MFNKILNTLISHSKAITLGLFSFTLLLFIGNYTFLHFINTKAGAIVGNPGVYGKIGQCGPAAVNQTTASITFHAVGLVSPNGDPQNHIGYYPVTSLTATLTSNFKVQHDQLEGANAPMWNCANPPHGNWVGPANQQYATAYQFPRPGAILTQTRNMIDYGEFTSAPDKSEGNLRIGASREAHGPNESEYAGFDCGWTTIPVSGTISSSDPNVILTTSAHGAKGSDDLNASLCENSGKSGYNDTNLACSIICNGNSCQVNNLPIDNSRNVPLNLYVVAKPALAPSFSCKSLEIKNKDTGAVIKNGDYLPINANNYNIDIHANGAQTDLSNVTVDWNVTGYRYDGSFDTPAKESMKFPIKPSNSYLGSTDWNAYSSYTTSNFNYKPGSVYQFDADPIVTYTPKGSTTPVTVKGSGIPDSCKPYFRVSTASIGLTKQLTTKTPALVGSDANYKIVITNTGNDEIDSLLLTDTYTNYGILNFKSANIFETNAGKNSQTQNFAISPKNGSFPSTNLIGLSGFKPLQPKDSFTINIDFQGINEGISVNTAIACAVSKLGIKPPCASMSAQVSFYKVTPPNLTCDDLTLALQSDPNTNINGKSLPSTKSSYDLIATVNGKGTNVKTVNINWNVDATNVNTGDTKNIQNTKHVADITKGAYTDYDTFKVGPFPDKKGQILEYTYKYSVNPSISYMYGNNEVHVYSLNCKAEVTQQMPGVPAGLTVTKKLINTGNILVGQNANFEITLTNSSKDVLTEVTFQDNFTNLNNIQYLSGTVSETNDGDTTTEKNFSDLGVTVNNNATSLLNLTKVTGFKALNPGDKFTIKVNFLALAPGCSTDVAVGNAISQTGKNLSASAQATACFSNTPQSPNTGANTATTIAAFGILIAAFFGKKYLLKYIA